MTSEISLMQRELEIVADEAFVRINYGWKQRYASSDGQEEAQRHPAAIRLLWSLMMHQLIRTIPKNTQGLALAQPDRG